MAIDTTVCDGRAPQICLATLRSFKRQVFRCGLYEAEDVLVGTNDVDLIQLQPGPGFARRDWWQKRLVYRDVTGRLVSCNPGLERVPLAHDYDLFVAICQDHEDLAYLSAIDNLHDRCRTSVCWIDELWIGSLHKFRHWLSALSKFDYVFIGSTGGTAPELSKAIDKECRWIPLGVDTLRFCPLPDPPARAIDVFSMGRTTPKLHATLRQMADSKEIFYFHDTFSAATATVYDYRQHRDVLASLAQRSRYFIVAPSKIDTPGLLHGQVEFGPRYYEGASAGAILIGQPPDLASFRGMFDWPDAVVDIALDGSDTAGILRELGADPERRRRISQRNMREALLRHDWVYRWQQIFEITGLEPSAGMAARKNHLREIADTITNGDPPADDDHAAITRKVAGLR